MAVPAASLELEVVTYGRDGRRPCRARDEERGLLGSTAVHHDDGHRPVRQVRERHDQRHGPRRLGGAADVDAGNSPGARTC